MWVNIFLYRIKYFIFFNGARLLYTNKKPKKHPPPIPQRDIFVLYSCGVYTISNHKLYNNIVFVVVCTKGKNIKAQIDFFRSQSIKFSNKNYINSLKKKKPKFTHKEYPQTKHKRFWYVLFSSTIIEWKNMFFFTVKIRVFCYSTFAFT